MWGLYALVGLLAWFAVCSVIVVVQLARIHRLLVESQAARRRHHHAAAA